MPTAAEHNKLTAKDFVALLIAVLVCFSAAGLGALVTSPRIPNWYQELVKPDWTPPGWLFGPVWSVLYLMMAFSAWIIWRKRGEQTVTIPLSLFAVQLVLNSLWSILFFGFQRPGIAVAEIVLLWVAILATQIAFWRLSRWAGGLLVPYLLWVSFAAALNVAIWHMNS